MVPTPNSKDPSKGDFQRMVVGKFISDKDVEKSLIKAWVFTWSTRDVVEVWKEEDRFFFILKNVEDYMEFIGRYHTLNFHGALMVLKPWFPSASFRSFNFLEAAIWVKVEGIPLTFHSTRVAQAMLSKMGKLMMFDEKSKIAGFKRWMRALMWVQVKKPLIPGCFFEYEEGKSVWVDFRYEGVFRFCKRCGKIGHNMVDCGTPWHHVPSEVNRAIIEASDLRIMYGREDAPLYSNKIKGLPNYDIFRATRVAVGYLPQLDFYG